MNEIWVLGATGRAGRAIAAELADAGVPLTLVGRDAGRLGALAEEMSTGVREIQAPSRGAAIAQIEAERPSVVVNTVGPFADTGVHVARACIAAGTHYIDLANELGAVRDVLALGGPAAAGDCSLVTGAGFGVLATESVVLALRGDRPPAARVRVDAVPVVDGSGPAVLASVIDSIGAGGWRYENGRLTPVTLGGDVERLELPDGTTVATVGVPTGELEAAHRAAGAPNVIAASSEVPSATAARAIMPVAHRLLAPAPARSALKRLVAGLGVGLPVSHGGVSWGHAVLEWDDGTRREGWLRVGEGYAFTARVAGQVARRLGAGEGRPGAFTPGVLFGVGFAEAAGGQLILDAANR
jgi:short subunit dehydrogenase-like uncharacterized protein